MNYHVRRQGEDLGIFSGEELRLRRQSGQFSGNEYVQREGAPDWQPIDLVLQYGFRMTPPPLPTAAARPRGANPALIGVIVVLSIFGILVFAGFFVWVMSRAMTVAQGAANLAHPGALAVASRPLVWTTNSLTCKDANKRMRGLYLREWAAGYKDRGQHDPALDTEVEHYLRVWIDNQYGGPDATNQAWFEEETEKLGHDPNCRDPLVLAVVSANRLNWYRARDGLEQTVNSFLLSGHKAYPKLYATVRYTEQMDDQPGKIPSLDASAMKLFGQCFSDGSFGPADQQEIVEILVNGWGDNFFRRNSAAICNLVDGLGDQYRWLALALRGDREINEAWAARGSGYASSVTAASWKGFESHLSSARALLTEAWKLRPDFPFAPCRMITVALGESDVKEMRLWFDRTTMAQVDYPGAWVAMRWGLRPRWFGNERSILALGEMAIRSGRFDTDVPHKYLDCLADLESEGRLSQQEAYGRSDVWPSLQKVYEGYISDPAQRDRRDAWRGIYAVTAYISGNQKVARTQLEALGWKLPAESLAGWGIDYSLVPLEVAACTGPLGAKVLDAESRNRDRDYAEALKRYTALNGASVADERTKQFITLRLSQLAIAQRLEQGEWVDLMPASDDDLNWVFSFGKAHRLPDGGLEVTYGPHGHMFFSRVPVGSNFEVRGQVEFVRSSNKDFQGGIVMGVPDFNSWNWYGFRLKRDLVEGDVVCLGEGWSRREISRKHPLTDTNTFDFILKNGRVTESVNGASVVDQAEPPVEITVPDQGYLVGLGAFSYSDETVIRYHDVQVRKLR